jgi:hypothetical protein
MPNRVATIDPVEEYGRVRRISQRGEELVETLKLRERLVNVDAPAAGYRTQWCTNDDAIYPPPH